MSPTVYNRRLPRLAGAALGVCLAVATIVLALPSRGHGGVAPASVDLSVSTASAVAVEPAAPSVLLHAADLRPGNGAAGAGFDLTNESGRAVAVGLRAVPSSTALDSLARVAIGSQGKTISDTTIEELRRGSSTAVELAPGEHRTLRVSIWIPSEVETGYEGKHVGIELIPLVRVKPGP